MWPFSDDEEKLDEITSDFSGVASSIFEQAETEEAGLMALQDVYNSYEFPDPIKAISVFQEQSDSIRKKFGDTKPFDFETTLTLAPRNFEEFSSSNPDPDQNNIDVINQWESENLKALKETTDLSQVQLRSQMERSIKQLATIKRREVYGSDNYLVTDQLLRLGQGAVGPLASLVGADSVNDWFTENTDPEGANVFGYTIGGDDSYWSAISSGLGSVAGAVGSGAVTGGWGTAAYLAASGAGSVRSRVEDALENEASTGEALTAGAIEGVSQAGQAFVGSKVFGGVVNKVLGKSEAALGQRVFPQVLKSASLEGGTEAAGQVVSNVGQNVGRGDEWDTNLTEGVSKSLAAGFVGGGLAEVGGELLSPKIDGATQDLIVEDPLLETEGTTPPPSETIPGKVVSTVLDTPGTPVAKLEDGSEIVESSGNFHLVKDGKVAQAFDVMQPVAPEVADKLRQLQIDGNPDGTAVTITTDGTNLFVESEFVNEDLTLSPQKTGRVRTPITTAETDQGSVPVFASKTRTTDGVRQNPSLIAPGKVESTAGAATAGYGGQKVTPYMQRMIDRLGTTLSENLGLIAVGDIETETGKEQIITPLITRFPDTFEGQAKSAVDFINKNGILGSLDYFANNDAFNVTHSTAANIIENKLQVELSKAQAEYNETPNEANLNKLSAVSDLFSEAVTLKDKVSTVGGELLGSLTDRAQAIHNAKAYGEFKVGQIEIDLTKRAYEKYKQETGEAVDISLWSKEAQDANAEVKAAQAKANDIQASKDKVDNLKTEQTTLEATQETIDSEIQKIEQDIIDLDKPKPARKRKETSDKQLGDAQSALDQAEETKKQRRDLLNKLKAAKKRREITAQKYLLATKRLAEAEAKATENEKLSPAVQEELATAKNRYSQKIDKILKAEKIRQEETAKLTPENKKTLAGMYEMLKTLNGEMKFKYAEQVFDKELELGVQDPDADRFEQLYNFYRGNLLSGPSTQLRNLVGNTSKFLSDVIGLIGAGEFNQAGAFLKGWLKATPDSLREAREIVQGRRAGRFKFDKKITDSKGNVKSTDKVAPLTNPLTAVQNLMYRFLTAQDAVFYRNANSAMANLAEYVANKNIKDPAERKAAMDKALGYSNYDNVKQQVEKEAQMLRDAGIEVNDRQVKLDIAYRMEQQRSERTQEISSKFGERSVFVNDPAGMLGYLYRGIETVTDAAIPVYGKEVKPLKYFLPFTRVAANVTSHLMEFTPIGAIKAAANKADGKTNALNHGLSDIEARMVMGRSVVGTGLLAGFYAMADAFKDEEDPQIAFYGYPPKGKWREWQAKGIEPFSMKLGNNLIPLQGTSLAIIPAIVGGMIESRKSGSDEKSVLMAGAVSSLGAVATMSFIKPAGDLFDALAGSKDQLTSEAGVPTSGAAATKFENLWKSQADNLATGFVPASGFLNNLGRWMNASPIETYNNLTAKLWGEMPYTEKLGTDKRPQLNLFGEPITKSLVQRFSAGMSPHTLKTDPVFLWMQETGFNIQDQGPIISLTRKGEKAYFAEQQKERTGYAGIMDAEQSRKVLEISGPRIKEFLNSIRKDPGFQVKSKEAQEAINRVVNEIRAEARIQVLEEQL